MKTPIVRIAIVFALLLGGVARADDAWISTGDYKPDRTLWIINWEASKPLGSFSDYISDPSYRGFTFEGRSFVRPNVSVGMSFSWNRFQQTYDMLTVPIPGGTASGPVYRYNDMFGIVGTAHFYLSKGALKPYLGGGIGGVWAYDFQQIADLSTSHNSFDFTAYPEAGLMYVVASGGTSVGLNLAARYTYTTADVGNTKDAAFASVILGLTFGY